MTSQLDHDPISDNDEGAEENVKDDRAYTIEYIVRHVGKGAKMQYVKRRYVIIAANDTMGPSANTPTHFMRQW